MYNLATTTRIIAATAVLHNICIRERIPLPEIVPFAKIEAVIDRPVGSAIRGNAIRAALQVILVIHKKINKIYRKIKQYSLELFFIM